MDSVIADGIIKDVVNLLRSVANYVIKREAVDLANYTSGVVNVINEITIE